MIATAATSLRLIMIGPPASGKGTQGRRLAKVLGLSYLSTGSLLRRHVERKSGIGQIAEPILARGGYLPDELMCSMMAAWLRETSGGWLLDGFPRSVPQALFLEQVLAENGSRLTAAISLNAPFETLVSRIRDRVECPACHWSGHASEAKIAAICPDCSGAVHPRADDSEENFTSRHRAFESSAMPLIDYYRERGLLSACDASIPRGEVTALLLQQLTPLLGSSI